MAWVLDLDGVVWLADQVLPGAAGAVERLRAAGERVLFVTNNSFSPVGDVEAKLAAFGIPAAEDVITSAAAAATLVSPGERVLVCGGPGVVEALERRGAHPVHDGDADAVVVGFHRSFDYERLRIAATAVRRGARLLATNDDATYPTPAGPIPGCGSILAAVATGAGAAPTVAGKPYPAMAGLLLDLLGGPPAMMVGDRPDTDGRFAEALGCPFGLVLSGVTTPGDLPVEPTPAATAADLATLVTDRLGR
ncbi:MAG: HAD-IIA family hydrolase [Acidimicrobiales bacterium]|nr:HAD-IIA family hydrolase [Acidimicrobiales bacterium]